MKKIKLITLIIVIINSLFILTGCSSENINLEELQSEISEESKEEIITVKDKWIKRTEDRDLYMIGTENEVFKIEDNAFIFKFDSSDIYNQMEVGKQYKIKTTGVRNNFMSWYRNINSIELYEGE